MRNVVRCDVIHWAFQNIFRHSRTSIFINFTLQRYSLFCADARNAEAFDIKNPREEISFHGRRKPKSRLLYFT